MILGQRGRRIVLRVSCLCGQKIIRPEPFVEVCSNEQLVQSAETETLTLWAFRTSIRIELSANKGPMMIPSVQLHVNDDDDDDDLFWVYYGISMLGDAPWFSASE